MKSTAIVSVMCLLLLAGVSYAQKPIGIGGAVELGVPMGDFGDAASLGFGFTGNFQYNLNPNMDLIGQVGYLMWGGKDEAPTYDFSWGAIPFQAGLKYFVTQGDSRFYVGGLAGFHNFSYSAEWDDPFFGHIEASDSELKFGLAPIGGYEIGLNEKTTFDISARYQFVDDDLSYFGLRGGIIYKVR
jgi:hypothetical protein